MATTEIEAPDPPESDSYAARAWRAAGVLSNGWNRFWRVVGIYMPKRLYARSLLIVIMPMILLPTTATVTCDEGITVSAIHSRVSSSEWTIGAKGRNAFLEAR